jgi:hypothetical protein
MARIEGPGPDGNSGDLWNEDPREDDATDGQRKTI